MKFQSLAKSWPKPGLNAVAVEVRYLGSSLLMFDARRSLRKLGQVATTLSLLAAVYAILILASQLQDHRPSSQVIDNQLEARRPAAFNTEEIFLPRTLLARVDDRELRDILRERKPARLDAFLDANGLPDVWFLVRYRALDATGATFLGQTDNFECKRYYLHSSRILTSESGWRNFEVFSRVMAKAAGREPDSFVAAIGNEEGMPSIFHFDKARIVPIPDEATGIKFFYKSDIDAWLLQAGQIDR